jgi:hypothetical protein
MRGADGGVVVRAVAGALSLMAIYPDLRTRRRPLMRFPLSRASQGRRASRRLSDPSGITQ